MSPALACLEHHCAMQTREPKEKPQRGLISLGPCRSMNSGIMLRHVSECDAWIKGTTLESWRGVILVPLLDGRTIGRSPHQTVATRGWKQTAAPRGAPGSRLAAHGPLSLNGYAKGIVLIVAARLSCFSILAMAGMGEG
jgi:hypothetical protein